MGILGGTRHEREIILIFVSLAVVSGQQWIMVFRGASGDIGGANNIFTLWNNLGTSGENVPCANSVGSRCSTHYKNKLVDNWNKMIIHKVKLSVYKNGLEMKKIMFCPPKSANKIDWFRKEYLNTSDYGDLQKSGSYSIFGIIGDRSSKRRFFISRWIGGSSGDPGEFWMGISERRDVEGPSLPAILFSPNYYSIRWTHRNIQVKEHDTITLRCENGGLIQVQSARYGLGSCWGSVTHILRRRCNSRNDCSTPAENSLFSDPCEGEHKVVQVEYVCGPATADEFAIYIDIEDQSKIQNCAEIDLDCYLSPRGHCKRCNSSRPVKLYNNSTECAWLCSQENRYCWPGTCGPDNVAKHCHCDDGFSTAKDSAQANCIMTRKPTIETCFAGVHGKNGEHVTLRKLNSSSACMDQRDNYINFLPNRTEFSLQYSFVITPVHSKPAFIKEYKFGIGGGSVSLRWMRVGAGNTFAIIDYALSELGISVGNLDDTVNARHTNTVLSDIDLQNGDGLCFSFTAVGKGYLQTTALHNPSSISPKRYYNETNTIKEKCFWFDQLKPLHCKVTKGCENLDTIQISSHITKSSVVTIGINGWKDQDIHNGKQIKASGIRQYGISVYGIGGEGSMLKPSLTADKSNSRISSNLTTFEIEFTKCGLYEINLEVQDNSGEGNVQISRRFVLFDNSSTILKDDSKRLQFTTAVNGSHKIWQTQKKFVCFDWSGRFYNSFQKKSNLLKPIETKATILDIYDDNEYPLPKNGTANVDGIIDFRFTIYVNDVKEIKNQSQKNVLIQNHCTNLTLFDGDSVMVELVATDIMGNTNNESTRVFIDTSVPEITNMGLKRGAFNGLFVHNTSELSNMKMTLTIKDIHSGILSIEWYFGTKDGSMDIGHGTLGVNRLPEKADCNNSTDCYYPSHGACEKSLYNVDMSKLIGNNTNTGLHNREYFFTFVVTNNAFLRTVDHVDILVDESAPVKGVVREGVFGEKDIDFTEENNTFINWDGFVDHESGILLYKVALSPWCLKLEEMLNGVNNDSIVVINTTENSARIYFPKEGTFISSVIAFNNAGEPSDVACSDGITYDLSPIEIFNLTGFKFTTGQGIACDDHHNPFLILRDLTKVSLRKTPKCIDICRNNTFPIFIHALPSLHNIGSDETYSEGICGKTPPFVNQEIYIPSGSINVEWKYRGSESQLQDFYVGFGQSFSEYLSPSLVSFEKTSGRSRYFNHHSGLRSAQRFWMYIKSTSKAGVEKTIPVGPLIIDFTPIVLTKDLIVDIKNKTIYIGWENQTFVDEEETDPISSILFRIGSGSTFVTPLLQHYKSQICPQANAIDCIVYPVDRLHRAKTENLLKYFAEVIITNKAGHTAYTRTKVFQIPSQDAPSRGIVIDINEESEDFTDLDYLLYPNKLCIKLKGFDHHENVSFKVGVGTRKGHADVIQYTAPSTKYKTCFNATEFKPFVKYYSIVKAQCVGGESVVSSDGFTFIEPNYFLSNFHVHDGKRCSSDSSDLIFVNTMKNITEFEILINKTLKIGKVYSIVIFSKSITLNSPKVRVLTEISRRNYKIFIFFPKSPILNFTTNTNKPFNASFYQCNLDEEFLKHTDEIFTYWYFENLIQPTQYIVHLREGIKNTLIAMQTIPGIRANASFKNVHLVDNLTYTLGVSPCFGQFCLEFKTSDGFIYNAQTFLLDIKEALITFSDNHATLNVNWEVQNEVLDSGELFGFWALTSDKNGRDILSKWTEVKVPNQVKTTLRNFESWTHKLYFCLKFWIGDEEWMYQCKDVKTANTRSDNHLKVFDFDFQKLNKSFVDVITHALFSEHLGSLYDEFLELETDYCSPIIEIAVLILGHGGENLKVFLMTSMSTPEYGDQCHQLTNCIMATSTNTGIALFKKNDFTHGSLLYSCVRGENKSYGCSDGILVDATPPKTGRIAIPNVNGFIFTMSALSLYVEPFLEDAMPIGTDEIPSIAFYEYAIGTNPQTDDVFNWRKSIHPGKINIPHLRLSQGETYFVTVSATNRAGLKSNYVVTKVTVDITPPHAGTVYVGNVMQKSYVSSGAVTVHWKGFYDDESHIKDLECALLSENGESVMAFYPAFGSSFNIMNQTQSLTDGHSYRAILKTTNYALLSTVVYSNNFTVDTSPPRKGTVFDGTRENEDKDYQTSLVVLCAGWSGFSDPHTDIITYRIGVGTNPKFPDIKHYRHIGLRQEYCWNMSLTSGLKYFTFVEACNRANLCTVSVSDGIIADNSPPLAGLIFIKGITGRMVYLNDRTSISASWVGFEDPHSSIDHFEWCIGTAKDNCEITSFKNSYLSADVYVSSVMLPLNTHLYLSLRAFNNVNLSTIAYSHAFKVDTSPPKILKHPKIHILTSPYTTSTSIQYDNSVLQVSWLFVDDESRISHHVVSLKSHHGKKVPYERVSHENINSLTITFNATNRLINGDRYSIIVTACNLASLCNVRESDAFVIDSSPPHLGGFSSGHLWQTSGNTTSVTISWYGFKDAESDIANYFISVGSSYNGGEYTKGFVNIRGSNTTATVALHEFIPVVFREVILSIYAVNNAGLKSKTAKATVLTSLSSKSNSKGKLVLQRHSCNSFSCNNLCTCGVVGLKCLSKEHANCNKLNESSTEVFIGSNNLTNIAVQPSSSCVTGSWISNSSLIKRYEWTIGIKDEDPGQGIYDIQNEDPWNDNNLETTILFCLPVDKTFVSSQRYVLYVRSWFSENDYSVSKSDSLLIKNTSPTINIGQYLLISKNKACGENIRYAGIGWKVCSCWRNVFEDNGPLLYTFSVGSTPKSDDILTKVYLGNQTEICPSLTLEPGLRYYFTVSAMNNVGLYTSLSSNDLVVDENEPSSGVVFNTPLQTNNYYQSNVSSTGVSWFGFSDRESFIQNYSFVTEVYENNSFHSIGTTSITLLSQSGLNISCSEGNIYRYAVQAGDAAGHLSTKAYSPSFTFDNTEPRAFLCRNKTLIHHEITDSVNTDFYLDLRKGVIYKFLVYIEEPSWDTTILLQFEDDVVILPVKINSNGSAELTVDLMAASTGRRIISITQQQSAIYTLRIKIYQCCPYFTFPKKDSIELTQFSSDDYQVCVRAVDDESGIFQIKVGLGTTLNGTQIRPLADIGDIHHSSIHAFLPHGSPVFAHAIAENFADLQSYFISKKTIIDHTPPTIKIMSVNLEYEDINNNTLTKYNVYFSAEDLESGVQHCKLCMGDEDNFRIHRCDDALTNHFKSKYLNLTHGTKFVPIVICVNNVELEKTQKGNTSIISFENPSIGNAKLDFIVPDPSIQVKGYLVQRDLTKIDVRWSGFEDKSGIMSFECKLQKGGDMIMNWVAVGRKDYASFNNLSLRSQEVYTVFVRAVNIGNKTSSPINASIYTTSERPGLTGYSATLSKSIRGMELNWENVFAKDESFNSTYDVSVGSAPGSSDIMREVGLQSTKSTIYLTEHGHVIYVVIKALFPTSTYRIYKEALIVQ